MTQEMDDDAEFTASFEETVNNDRFIDWRYWAKLMPVWTSAQAARLMCALDPDIFESYEAEPNANDRSKPIAMSKSIERLAHAQQVAVLAPSEWLVWAKRNGFSVSPWLQQIVTRYEEEKRLAQSTDDLWQKQPQHERKAVEVSRAVHLLPPPPVTILRPTGHKALVRLKTRTPDWERWSRLDIVRLWQAACLAVDIEPPKGEIWAIYQLDSFPQAFHDMWEVINADAELAKLEMLEYSGRMLWSVSLPGFATWALKKRISIPMELQKIAKRIDGGLVDQAQPAAPSPVPRPEGQSRIVTSDQVRENRRRALLENKPRGSKGLVLEHWDTVEKLYGPGANGRDVRRLLQRQLHQSEKIPELKTIQNNLSELRNLKLIP